MRLARAGSSSHGSPIVSTIADRTEEAAVASPSSLRAPDRLMSVDELCEFLGVGRSYVYRLTHERRITYYRIGKELRFAQRHLEAFLEASCTPARDPWPPVRPRNPMSQPRRRQA